jgi:hypothetical protein
MTDKALEEVHVAHWNLERFVEIGFTLAQAEALTDARVDWHEAQKLVGPAPPRKPCDHATAFDILMPLLMPLGDAA